MTPVLVSIEQAKALKELGFDLECESFVTIEEDSKIMRPTISQAFRWLRKKRRLFVVIDTSKLLAYWMLVRRINPNRDETRKLLEQAYEKSLLEGLDNALKHLKQQDNGK